MMRRSPAMFFLGAGLLVVLGACATTPAVLDLPSGFARYGDEDLFTIVSPDAVVLRVKTAENSPEQTLDFWADAVSIAFERSGYAAVGTGEFTSSLGDGVWFEWVAPVGEEDYVYLTALSLSDDTIAIVEAAGPYELYHAHRPAVHQSLASLALR